TERDPLIRQPTVYTNADGASRDEPEIKRRLGPLEISASNRRGILAGIWLGTWGEHDRSSYRYVFVNIDGLASFQVMPSISSEFQKFHLASWLGTAYLLARCTFTPLYGRLSNVMGRRGANSTAIAFAAIGTIMCGLSRNIESLIAARFVR
ncbi:hypothetical protein R3P38DRAFT_2417604, partial [Favolaschia claudopus]